MSRYPQRHTFITKNTTNTPAENIKPHFEGGPQITHTNLEMVGQHSFSTTQLSKQISNTKRYRSIEMKNKPNYIVQPNHPKINFNAKSKKP